MFKNIVVLLFSTLICFVAFELIARKFLTVGDEWSNSSTWALEKWIENHRDARMETTTYGIDRYDSLYGWTLKQNLRSCCENIGDWRVNSNSKGVRGLKEYPYERTGKLRILTIGDSFTFGECVADSQTFPAVLETLLDSAEVINLAVHGYGNDQELIALMTEGVKYNPDIVVLGFVNDDVNRNKVWFRDYAKPYFEIQGDTLQLRGVPVPPPDYYLKPFRLKSWSLIKAKYGQLTADVNNARNKLVTKKILDKMIDVCGKVHAKFMVIYLPWINESVENKSWADPLYDTLCSRHGVISIDPIPAVHNVIKNDKKPEDNFNCHYSPKVYRTLAEQLAAEIKKQMKPKASN